MTDWLILIVVLPAILAPVVLLVGFTGCHLVFQLDPIEEPEFETAFEQSLVLGPGVGDEGGWEGYTLVQRIEPARLSRSGTEVRLTLRASSGIATSVDRIYISQPGASDPYDSAADLAEVFDRGTDQEPLILPANESVLLPAAIYNLDREQPLLIAFDFSPAPPSAISYRGPVPLQEGAGYWRLGAEAAAGDRSDNYSVENRIYLIERIEVR